MNLEQWLTEGKLKAHQTTSQEVAQLMEAVVRNIRNATIVTLSANSCFTIAYHKPLLLSTILHRLWIQPSVNIGQPSHGPSLQIKRSQFTV